MSPLGHRKEINVHHRGGSLFIAACSQAVNGLHFLHQTAILPERFFFTAAWDQRFKFLVFYSE
jgi:hypothetical protein